MDNQIFFYPPYPYMDENENNDAYLYERKKTENKNLMSPDETLSLGNAWKNEYVPYLNYKPVKIDPKNTNDAKKIELMALMDQCHDIRLYLDIYPEDAKMYELYVHYCKKYKEAKEQYEATQMKLFPESYDVNSLRRSYIFTPSPWMR